MKKNILTILIFIITVMVSYYISNDDNNDITKTISYNGNNLRISIDGESSSTLPTSGTYYLVDYDCKSSNTKIEWDKTSYKLNISNRTKKSDIVCDLEFKSRPLLSDMEQGSYVAYTGDSENGCDNTNIVNGWTSCMGKNVNYESDIKKGYCHMSKNQFAVNGWRLAYIENEEPHLISAGATDCMCTSSNGILSSSSCSGNLGVSGLNKHFENMNAIALKYCNKDYARDGLCDVTTSWAMKATKKTQTDTREMSDFKKITGSDLSSNSCYSTNVQNRFACGYTNDLIDNGGYYWFANRYSDVSTNSFFWNPLFSSVDFALSSALLGVRPVLALDSSVIVVGGDGTYENPYEIVNNNFRINDYADKSNVRLILSGSDVSTMCISVNTSVCNNYVAYSNNYTLDLSSEKDGEKFIYVYYKDVDGNIIASMNKSIIISTSSS